MQSDADDWQARADELHEEMGVPRVRAEIVALRETGLTYAEIADKLDKSGKEEVGRHVHRYRDQRTESKRLLADGPEI